VHQAKVGMVATAHAHDTKMEVMREQAKNKAKEPKNG
jgi:hypothetical protein